MTARALDAAPSVDSTRLAQSARCLLHDGGGVPTPGSVGNTSRMNEAVNSRPRTAGDHRRRRAKARRIGSATICALDSILAETGATAGERLVEHGGLSTQRPLGSSIE